MNWKDVLIIIVLIGVVGGLFAYEYWWEPKEEAKGPKSPKIIEEKKRRTSVSKIRK